MGRPIKNKHYLLVVRHNSVRFSPEFVNTFGLMGRLYRCITPIPKSKFFLLAQLPKRVTTVVLTSKMLS